MSTHPGEALRITMMWWVMAHTHTNPPSGFFEGLLSITRDLIPREISREIPRVGKKKICLVIYNPSFTGKGQKEETLKNDPVGAFQPLEEGWQGGFPLLGLVGHRLLVARCLFRSRACRELISAPAARQLCAGQPAPLEAAHG